MAADENAPEGDDLKDSIAKQLDDLKDLIGRRLDAIEVELEESGVAPHERRAMAANAAGPILDAIGGVSRVIGGHPASDTYVPPDDYQPPPGTHKAI